MVNNSKPVAALFGGSFDPPHAGHQEIVEKALASLEIDRLIILPAYLNPFKSSSVANAQQRLTWCRQLFDSIPNVIVDDYEIKQGKSVKTAQSVAYFKQMYDVKYLIIGADNLSTLTQWYNFTWLNNHFTWVIATREGYPIETGSLRSWKILETNTPVSSSHIRQTLETDHIDTKIEYTVKQILKGQH